MTVSMTVSMTMTPSISAAVVTAAAATGVVVVMAEVGRKQKGRKLGFIRFTPGTVLLSWKALEYESMEDGLRASFPGYRRSSQ